MAKTEGKRFEEEFEDRWGRLGKTAWFHRFQDPADLYGLNDKKIIVTSELPSDYICAWKGWTGLVECKTTINPVGFPMSNIKRGQIKAAIRLTAAGGDYRFCIKNLKTNDVYFVPAGVLINAKGRVLWETFRPWLWSTKEPCLTPKAG
jgi:penicillin-binding protein-related factor A (putative recombinase)